MTSILFVCLGNICRSPLAEGLMREAVREAGIHGVTVDSAGCGGWHTGEAPDRRALACAARHGLDISNHRARQVNAADFQSFDLILGLDRDNVRHLNRIQPAQATARVGLFLEEALDLAKDVPDPYYGGDADFEAVYALCEKAARALAVRLTQNAGKP
ncbi:MAG: low molecular weight protein-tyrosine-phosphatase [Asticcacaulis sp.]